MRTNYEIARLVKYIDLSEKHKAKFIVTIRRKKTCSYGQSWYQSL